MARGAPKVIIEAFPGMPLAFLFLSPYLCMQYYDPLGPGALTRALLTLPRDSFDKLIVLEEQPKYLEYLKVAEPFSSSAHIRSISHFMT